MKSQVVPFGATFAVGGLVASLLFLGSDLIPEEDHRIVLIVAAGLLWITCLYVAARRQKVGTQVATAIGTTWGFFFCMSVAISIQNGRVSVNWPTMIPGLVVIPLAILLTTIPVFVVSRRFQARRAAE